MIVTATRPRRSHAARLPVSSVWTDRKSTRLNSSHLVISYAVFCLKKKAERAGKPLGNPHPQSDQRGISAIRMPSSINAGSLSVRVFFFNDTATTEIYTLSLHDALPICLDDFHCDYCSVGGSSFWNNNHNRSEEHTSELQSPCNLVCRLLLEKKNHK